MQRPQPDDIVSEKRLRFNERSRLWEVYAMRRDGSKQVFESYRKRIDAQNAL